MIQTEMFDIVGGSIMAGAAIAPARASDPSTSHLAVEDAKKNAAKGRQIALQVLQEHRAGLTDFELATLAGWQQTSIGKRRGELRDLGLVIDSGLRRPSPSGSKAIVWRVNQCNI